MRRWVQSALLAAAVATVLSATIVIALPRLVPSLAVKAATTALSDTDLEKLAGMLQNPDHRGSSAAASVSGRTPRDPWWATVLGKVAWPSALIVALLLIAWNGQLRRLFGAGTRLVRSIKAAGVEMQISSDAVDEVRQELRASFRELVSNARDEYERMSDLQDIDGRLASVMESIITADFSSAPSGLRATIHVRDIVFRDYLYQLSEYYPRGGGAHRRFSQRYGIIGRSWRSGSSHGTGNAFGARANADSLVEEWGMTREETHGILNTRPSCLSVLLRSGGMNVGILYVDSTDQNAFGDDGAAQTYALALESKSLMMELATAVDRVITPLRAAGPNLDLKEVGR